MFFKTIRNGIVINRFMILQNNSDNRTHFHFSTLQEWERERRLRIRQQKIDAKKAKEGEDDI